MLNDKYLSFSRKIYSSPYSRDCCSYNYFDCESGKLHDKRMFKTLKAPNEAGPTKYTKPQAKQPEGIIGDNPVDQKKKSRRRGGKKVRIGDGRY